MAVAHPCREEGGEGCEERTWVPKHVYRDDPGHRGGNGPLDNWNAVTAHPLKPNAERLLHTLPRGEMVMGGQEVH
jgi:hypothetical protein